jgi:hypothetical protein
LTDYATEEAPTSVTIPEGVTTIGNNAFNGNNLVSTIIIGTNVEVGYSIIMVVLERTTTVMEKKLQKALLHFDKKENYVLVKEALKKLGIRREELGI